MSVFKTYDIRGVWEQGIDLPFAYRLGRTLLRYRKAKGWLLGYDARAHSRELYQALASGLLEEGAQVTGVGLCSTPMLHYSQMDGKYEAAVMVTASHNPKEYHGFKVFDATGGSLSYDKGLKDVEALFDKVPEVRTVPTRSFPEKDTLEAYIRFIAGSGQGKVPAGPVVIDASNGSGGKEFRALANALGVDARLLNETPDGTFPNHDPNPLKEESRRQAAEAVVQAGAILGVILDGDGDRILFVDEKGRGIENYFLSCLVAEGILRRQAGTSIVYDLISSRVLPERVTEMGGRPVVSRVGYTFLYDQMVASRAAFGAETSGHVYFRVSDTYYTESAAYALASLLRFLAQEGRPLSALVDPLRSRYVQSPEINVEVKDKERAMREIERRYAGGKMDRLDGISVEFPDYWFNVRPSNTEPLLRLRLEGRGAAVVDARTKELRALLEQ
ncbi:MAG TPA: phosphomannomutase/phosphoglucomutase [Spirochaetia bacterium]|nr:phosphomannomutase/phosphoglucomutase [Spirochaetia bacterium]